jgi:acylphosphatase
MLKVRAHIFVSGMVQGVFFRSTTASKAQRLRVLGWVRNLQDGRVEAVFEGEKEAVDALIDFCNRGPRGARISSVDVKWEAYEGVFGTFEAR